MTTYSLEVVIDCPECNHSFDQEINIGEGQHSFKDGLTKFKCPQCSTLLGTNAELDIDLWDRSADSEG